MIKLFEQGENNMVQLNKEWISLIPEFRRLLARDKGGPGDGSGKYKKQAQREFTFIFLNYDFRSPLENMDTKAREAESLRCAELTRGRMESDGDLWDAIKKYQQLLEESSNTLKNYRKLKGVVDKTVDYVASVDLDERTITGGKVHSIKDVQDATNGMPKMQETLNKYEAQVRQELTGEEGLRGGAEKGEDEDPDESDY